MDMMELYTQECNILGHLKIFIDQYNKDINSIKGSLDSLTNCYQNAEKNTKLLYALRKMYLISNSICSYIEDKEGEGDNTIPDEICKKIYQLDRELQSIYDYQNNKLEDK